MFHDLGLLFIFLAGVTAGAWLSVVTNNERRPPWRRY